jgi:Cys-tRNA(Pro)/Cys-tRNA(Cys) deacylase
MRAGALGTVLLTVRSTDAAGVLFPVTGKPSQKQRRLRLGGLLGCCAVAATPAVRTLDQAKVTYTLREYDPDSGGDGHGYGEAAVAALDADPDQVFKTLVARVDGVLTVAVVPVSGQLDLKALAAAAGGRKAAMADPADAERSSGYVRGGISPLGQRKALPTVIDESALGFGTVTVSAGRRGLQVELPPEDLVRLTRARTAAIAR